MPKRKKRDDDDENIPEFNRDLSIIEHSVKFQGIRVINALLSKLNEDGWGTRGSIEHLPHEINAAKDSISDFLRKKYQNKTDDQGRIYITPKDIKSLETALDKLNNYKYPTINKIDNTITNWKEIIKELNSGLKPILEEIRESYMKYLPENERNIQFAPLENQEEDVEMVSDEEEEGSVPITSWASVGGRRKYRKKRTKKRRKSKGRKRRKSRRRKRTRKTRKKRGGVKHSLTNTASNHMLTFFRDPRTQLLIPGAQLGCNSSKVLKCLDTQLNHHQIPRRQNDFSDKHRILYNKIIQECKPDVDIPWPQQSGEGMGGGGKRRRKKRTKKRRKSRRRKRTRKRRRRR